MTKFRRRWPASGIVGLLAVLSLASSAIAQTGSDYPSRTIKIISPFAPGGITDTFSRLIGAKLLQKWGQTVVVENRPGAGGSIGADAVAKSAPDGYTLIMGNVGTHAINQFLMKGIPYDTASDFAPISLVIESDGVLVANNDLPARTLPELITLAKTGQLSLATAGVGTTSHLAGELFKQKVGANLAIVHYRGAAPSVTDVMSGVTSMSFATMQTVLPLVQSGKVRPIAIFSEKRSSALPDIPTMPEAGLPGFSLSNWIGLFAPAGTAPEIIAKLNTKVREIMQSPPMQERLKNDGARFTPYTPEQFAAFQKKEAELWGPLVKASGASID
jgi:tripartite-type tricarboxylate transporter receptor subunit TctC